MEEKCETCNYFWYSYNTNPYECDVDCDKENELAGLEDEGIDTSEYGNSEPCPFWKKRQLDPLT